MEARALNYQYLEKREGARRNSRRLRRRSGHPEHRACNSYRDREKARKAGHARLL